MRDLKTIIVLVLLALNLIPKRSHHLLNEPCLVTNDQGFFNSYSLTRGWHNNNQSLVVSITIKLVLHDVENFAVYRRNNCGPKIKQCPEALLTPQ